MELVYLWVEKYKNIKSQGFNFSSRFKYSSNKIIDKKKNNEKYAKNFFDNQDNIKFTAIVGENGTGKSSIIEQLASKGKTYFVDKDGEVISNPMVNIVKILPNDFNNKKYNIEIIYLANNAKGNNFFQHSFLPTYINFDLSFEYNIDNLFNLALHSLASHQHNSGISEYSKIDIDYLNKEFNKILTVSIQNIFTKKDFKEYIYFKHFIQIIIQYYEGIALCEYEYDEKNNDANEYETEIGRYLAFLYEIVVDRNGYIVSFINEIIEEVKKYNTELENIVGLLNQLHFDEKIKTNDSVIIEIKTENYDVLEKLFKYDSNKLLNLHFLKQHDSSFVKLNELSKGEEDYLKLYAIIYFNLKNKDMYTLVLLDETIVYWHPKWQKYLIKNLIDFYIDALDNVKVHTIITTHSPFILSDIPKENTLFLDTYKKNIKDENNIEQQLGNCKNITNEIELNSFAANIHTILSHGFFMKDGLMGAFAKEKIDNIISLLNKPSLLTVKEEEECAYIISIIGEPIIRKQLQHMLDSRNLESIKKNKVNRNEIVQDLVKALDGDAEMIELLKEALKNDTN